MKQIKQILLGIIFLYGIVLVNAQPKHPLISTQLKRFYQITAKTNVTFIFPPGFKEIRAVKNDRFSFDYALELPGKDFEIWFDIRSQKENWADYDRYKSDVKRPVTNSDSLFEAIGAAHAVAFTGDNNYFEKSIPPEILARYNADSGKSYLLNLLDAPATRHYKYALLIILQKNRVGTIMAVCFGNDKGAEFFENINKAGNCLKFKR